MSVTHDVIILIFLISGAAAQPPAAPPPYTFSPSVPTLVVIVLLVLFLVGFFFLCSSSNSPSSLLVAAASSLRRRNPGLDAAALAAFPVFLYSEVKELKIGKNALECAICINEFDDDETLKLIPVCDHVFHPDCIDAWLQAHVTCPVCRANLAAGKEKEAQEVDPDTIRIVPHEEEEVNPFAVQTLDQSLDSRRAKILGPLAQSSSDQSLGRRIGFFRPPAQDQSVGRRTGFFFGKFPRSHSTGHSLVRPGEDTERFTLRFPGHVRKEAMTHALVRAATFNYAREGREGGSSWRGGRSYKKMDRAVKSDRWVINVPFFSSSKGTDDGEGSSRGRVMGVRLPSFKCLEPSASGDVDNLRPVRPAV